MTISASSEQKRMTITRVFDAPRELVWKAWTDPKYVMMWWGPKGFTAPVCKIDFRVGGKFLCCMRSVELTAMDELDEDQVLSWMAQAAKKPFVTAAMKKK